MAVISQTLRLEDKMSSTLSSITKAMESTLYAMKSIKGANFGAEFKAMESDINSAKRAMDDLNQSMNKTPNKSGGLGGMFDVFMGNMLTQVVSRATQSMRQLVAMSDNYTSNTARLSMVLDNYNDKQMTTAQLQDKIYQSAQRSRGSLDALTATVAKLGNQATNAFSSADEIVNFGELLNKTFTISGMDAMGIESTMYNMTQSLSTGRLLGQDYRILKQNAPQMIKYIEQFYGVNRAELDDMVSKGRVTAEDLKQAMFKASNEINEKFKKMPMTWGQLWTKITNAVQKMLQPLLLVISDIVNFIDAHSQEIVMVIEGIAVAVGILTAAWVLNKVEVLAVKLAHDLLNGSLLLTKILMAGLIAVAIGLAIALVYLWNTNDDAAYYMLLAWDGLVIGIQAAALTMKSGFYGILDGLAYLKMGGLVIIAGFVDGIIELINLLISAINAMTGSSIEGIDTMSSRIVDDLVKENEGIEARAAEIESDRQALVEKTKARNESRESRVEGRKRLETGVANGMADALGQSGISDLVGTDGKGGKALKTTSNDNLLSDEDVQMLLDIATRDYQLSYQQVTPNVTVTFGDVRETADVNQVMDAVGTAIEDIINGDGEIKN